MICAFYVNFPDWQNAFKIAHCRSEFSVQNTKRMAECAYAINSFNGATLMRSMQRGECVQWSLVIVFNDIFFIFCHFSTCTLLTG